MIMPSVNAVGGSHWFGRAEDRYTCSGALRASGYICSGALRAPEPEIPISKLRNRTPNPVFGKPSVNKSARINGFRQGSKLRHKLFTNPQTPQPLVDIINIIQYMSYKVILK
jgi:hypothetical protein